MTKLAGQLLLASTILVLVFLPSLPASASTLSTPTSFSIPFGDGPGLPITTGPDGALWFAEGMPANQVHPFGTQEIARLTTSGTFTQFPIPLSADFNEYGAWISSVVTGPDGAIWFVDAQTNQIERFTIDGQFSNYVVPSQYAYEDYDDVFGLTVGPDGALWFTMPRSNNIGRITTSGNITESPLPNGNTESSIGPRQITQGPDGALWFTEATANNIGRITTTGDITEYPVPTANAGLDQIAPSSDGSLWFAENGAKQIGHISTAGNITAYQLPSDTVSGPDSITPGPDGSLWFTTLTDDGNQYYSKLGRITNSGTISEYSVFGPHSDAYPVLAGITTGPDGALWLTDEYDNQIVRIDPTLLVVPLPPTNLTASSPTQAPMLSWTASSGAISYNIYRDGTNIGSSTTNSYTDTTASPGDHTYYVTAINSAGESGPSNSVDVQVVTAPAITNSATASTTMRQPFTFTVMTTGSPTPAITETGTLPSGITFQDNGDGTATLSGQAASGSSGSYPLTFTANNGVGSTATQNFTLTVTSANSAPAITSSASDTESYGLPFSFTVTTTGYPVPALIKTGTLPSGITFTDNHDGTATLAGTPTGSASGVYPLSLKATSSAGTATQSFSLTITKAPVIKPIATKTAKVGQNFTTTLTSTGYTTPTLSLSGTLPSGLSFTDHGNGTGTISGTPATGSGGSFSLTLKATNSYGTATQSFTLKVNEAPSIISANAATATIGQAFSFSITTTGYPAPAVTKRGTLPRGITFNAAIDTFSGTPKAGTAGSYSITISAKNSSGTVAQNFVLTVN